MGKEECGITNKIWYINTGCWWSRCWFLDFDQKSQWFWFFNLLLFLFADILLNQYMRNHFDRSNEMLTLKMLFKSRSRRNCRFKYPSLVDVILFGAGRRIFNAFDGNVDSNSSRPVYVSKNRLLTRYLSVNLSGKYPSRVNGP